MRLVFLNGWAASSKMLESFKSYLPSSYELYILDDLYQFQGAEIVSRIDELMTTETILVGWSLGGMLALYYASLSSGSHQAKALILLNSSTCFLERHDFTEGVNREDFDALKQVIQAQDTKALLRLFGHLLVQGSLSHKEDRRLLKHDFNAETLPSWKVLSKGLDYLEALDLRETLSAIQQPTLFMLGERDVLVNASSSFKLLEKNTNFTVNIIPEMGHFPFGVFAREAVNIVVDYVSSLNKSKC
tara:strand:+ start:58403 stop:59137 length:735 start_codon:yes stop_codon:yes gene_type:complete